MSEAAIFVDPSLDKPSYYAELRAQLKVFLEGETNLVARAATIAATLGETRRYLWAGYYLVQGQELILGPFAGPLACFRIAKGRGVCGQAWAREEDLLVPNVNEFPGHIACSSLSNSEVVIPLRGEGGRILGVLDIDHVQIGGLDADDLGGLRLIADLTLA